MAIPSFVLAGLVVAALPGHVADTDRTWLGCGDRQALRYKEGESDGGDGEREDHYRNLMGSAWDGLTH